MILRKKAGMNISVLKDKHSHFKQIVRKDLYGKDVVTDRIWISLNQQRRNVGLAAATGARLYMSDLN